MPRRSTASTPTTPPACRCKPRPAATPPERSHPPVTSRTALRRRLAVRRQLGRRDLLEAAVLRTAHDGPGEGAQRMRLGRPELLAQSTREDEDEERDDERGDSEEPHLSLVAEPDADENPIGGPGDED